MSVQGARGQGGRGAVSIQGARGQGGCVYPGGKGAGGL